MIKSYADYKERLSEEDYMFYLRQDCYDNWLDNLRHVHFRIDCARLIHFLPQKDKQPFYFDVETLEQVAYIMRSLTEYDSYLLNTRLGDDYYNTFILEVFRDNKWVEWDDGYGVKIDFYVKEII